MTTIQIDEKLAKAATDEINRLRAENAALAKALESVLDRAEGKKPPALGDAIAKALATPSSTGNDVGGESVVKSIFTRSPEDVAKARRRGDVGRG